MKNFISVLETSSQLEHYNFLLERFQGPFATFQRKIHYDQCIINNKRWFCFCIFFFSDKIMASSLWFIAFALVILSAAAQDSIDEGRGVGPSPSPSPGKSLNQPYDCQSSSLLQTIVRVEWREIITYSIDSRRGIIYFLCTTLVKCQNNLSSKNISYCLSEVCAVPLVRLTQSIPRNTLCTCTPKVQRFHFQNVYHAINLLLEVSGKVVHYSSQFS